MPAAHDLAARLGVSVAGRLADPPPTAHERAGLDPARMLPVRDDLAPLLPGGALRRGTAVAVAGSLTLALALIGAGSDAGSWCALVGIRDAGLLAAAELGLDLERLALVPEPGPDWAVITAALVDSLDIVVVRPPTAPAAATSSRLRARLRERGSVLVSLGQWPGAELTLRTVRTRCYGLGDGHGRLSGYELVVESRGRGAAARPRHATLSLGDARAHRPAPSRRSRAA